MRKISELHVAAHAPAAIADVPWSSALNETVERDEIAVTLLALDVADGFLRLTGIVRVGDRPDIRVASIPQLELGTPDSGPLPMVNAHLMPHGRLTWVSWIYERSGFAPERLEATIGNIVFEYSGTRSTRLEVEGPWSFSLRVQPPSLVPVADDPGERIGS